MGMAQCGQGQGQGRFYTVVFMLVSRLILIQIYHATCRAEMATSATLASKLRADESAAAESRSRSGTPEHTAPSTPTRSSEKAKPQSPNRLSPGRTLVADALSFAGVKRKAEDNARDVGSLETLEGTPPSKKIVLSAA